tara:strand:- start:17778 stop:18287 length:510 start_codon:yes stop_codon:yes gene_type:complete
MADALAADGDDSVENVVLVRARKKLCRRQIDKSLTLERFRKRISDLSDSALRAYIPDGCWMTTYDVWDSHTDRPLGDLAENNAFVLMEIARERGINVRGVATEHKSNGMLISKPYGDNESPTRLYVGRNNTFNNLKAHEILSIQPIDKVYLPTPAPDTHASETAGSEDD